MSNPNPSRPGYLPLAIASLCLLPGSVAAQARFGGTAIFGALPDLSTPAGYVTADLDGDGRLDLVAAGHDGTSCRLLVLLQDSFGHYPGVSSEPLGAGQGLCGGHEALALGDLDGDADLDLVAQGKDNSGTPRLLWLAGSGNGTFSTPIEVRSPGLWDGAVALGDLDGDGDLDLVASGRDGGSGCGAPCHWPGFRMLVFRHDGAGFTLAAEPYGVDRGLAFGSSLAVGDVDDDGDLDVIASGETTEQSRALDLLRNDGTGALTRDPAGIPSPGLGSGLDGGFLRLGDLDLDGDLDLLAAGDLCCPTRQDLLAFANLGGSFAPPQVALRLASGSGFGGLALGDADGNGFPDVVVNGWEAGTSHDRYFANLGGVLVQEQVLSDGHTGPLLLGDFDGDLDLDAVTLPFRMLDENLLGPPDAAPPAPTAPGSAVLATGHVDLTWVAPSDAESGTALAYEIRLGSAPGVHDRFTGVFPPSLGTAPLGRLGAQPGRRIDLPQGHWYWQVRAIDTGLRPGPWSAESDFFLARATNTNDGGPGSLREALALANSDGRPTRIAFHPSLRGQTIALGSLLAPLAENDTTIDGDLDGDCVPDVGLSGEGSLDWALFVNSSGSTIRGLAISGFAGAAIRIQGGPGNLVTCNHIGLDVAGSTTPGNQAAGLSVEAGASGNQVGPGNVFTGNARAGGSALQLIDGVESNLFPHFAGHPADYTGRFPVLDFPGNCQAFRSADGIVPTLPGGQVFHSTFGAEFLGTLTVSTSGDYTFRVLRPDDLVQVRVGGTLVVDASCCSTVETVHHLDAGASPIDVDFLDFNNCHGFALEISGPGTATLTTGGQPGLQGSLHLLRVGTERDRVTRNAFRDNGPATSLDLAGNQDGTPQGATGNDPDDTDLGPNTLLNYPELAAPQDLGGGSFRVSGTAPANALVELFASPPDPTRREAHAFLADTTASGAGTFSLDVSVPPGLTQLTATATDALGNTSELSGPQTAQAHRFQSDPAVFPPIPIPQPAGLAAGDLDGDGRPDVVMAGGGGGGSCRLLVLLQGSDGLYHGISQEPMGPGQGLCGGNEALALGDVDGDGDLDLVAQGKDGSGSPRLLLFRNDGDGNLVPQGPDLLSPGLWDGAVALGDLDGDGDLDLVATGQDGSPACGEPCRWTGFRFYVLRNDGSLFTPIQQPIGIERGYARGSSIALGDVDSDGDLDALVSGETTGGSRELDLFLNWGPQNQGGLLLETQVAGFDGLGILQGHLRAADTDLDGDLDLVGAGETYDGSTVHQDLFQVRNDGGTWSADPPLARQAAGENFSGLSVGGVDEDGWPDAVVLASQGGQRLRWYRNEHGTLALAEDVEAHTYGPLLLADVDGDADLDAVVLPPNDGLWRNVLGTAVTPPLAPRNLESFVQPDGRLALSWTAPPEGGRTPRQALAYEVRAGRFAGTWDVVSGVFPESAAGTFPLGRLSYGVPGRPLALPQGSFAWQVRAIDTAFQVGPWSATASGSAPRSLSVGDAEAVEGAPVVFSVRLSSPSSQPITVAFTGQGLEAQPGADYDAVSGVLTFAPGETLRTITVSTRQDAIDEDDETFTITLAAASGGVALADGRALGTIRDDDDPPTLSIESASVPEGNAGSSAAPLTVRLSAPSGRSVGVDVSTSEGTASAGLDYTPPASPHLTFAPGSVVQTFAIDVLGDTLLEGHETVQVALSAARNASLGTPSATLTILDDEHVVQPPPVDGDWQLVREGMPGSGSCGLAASGNTYVYLGAPSRTSMSDLWASADGGTTWSRRTNPDTVGGRGARGVAWGGEPGSEQFVAVGHAGPTSSLVLTSPDGFTWTQRDPAPFNGWLECVSYGAGLWVAVGNSGSGQGRIVTSPDGLTWTERSAGGAGNLNGIAFGNGRFVAVGENRTFRTSTDGLTWSGATAPPAPQSLRSVSWTGARFVAVGATVTSGVATPGIVTSVDGQSWAARSVPPATGDLSGVASGAGVVLAVGKPAPAVSPDLTLGQVAASTDGGLTWAAVPMPPLARGVSPNLQHVAHGGAGFLGGGVNGNLYASATGTGDFVHRTLPGSRHLVAALSGAGGFCAIGHDGAASFSTDGGQTWTDATSVPDPARYPLWIDLAYAHDTFVAVGGPGAAIMTSPDCHTWTLRSPTTPPAPGDPLAGYLSGVSYGGPGFVAFGHTFLADGTSQPKVLSSPDGITWTQGTLPLSPSAWHSVIPVGFGPNRLVAVATDWNAGQMIPLTSSDGLAWTRQPPLPSDTPWERIDGIAHDGTQFIAVGNRIWTSPDGSAWTPRTPWLGYLLDVRVGNGRRVAVGMGGITWASADGLNWVEDANATSHDLYAVAHGGFEFVAVGASAITRTEFVPLLSVADVALPEGNSGSTSAAFTITLGKAAESTVTVAYATVAGTAAAGTDYTSRSGSLTFTPGQTAKTVSVPVIGDLRDEPDEVFRLDLSSPVGAGIARHGLCTIVDDDATPSLSLGNASATEGSSGTKNLTFTATLSAASGRQVTVAWATADASATAPSDYTAGSGALTFAAGTVSRTFTVAIKGDTLAEPNEDFLVVLSSPVNAGLGAAQGAGTITNDDGTPPQLSISDVTLVEGDDGPSTATFTVTLSPAAPQAVSADFATIDGTATAPSDYSAITGTLSFPVGVTSLPLQVQVNGDRQFEGDETFQLLLTLARNAGLADPAGLATITNDDAAAIPHLDTLQPISAAPGTPGLSLRLLGASFTPQSSVLVRGTPAPVTYLSPAELIANVGPGPLSTPGTAEVVVLNGPAAVSNVSLLPISSPHPTLAFGKTILGTSPPPQALVQADLDRDGMVDLVTTRGNAIAVYRGQGDGSFAFLGTYPTATPPVALLVADLDRDGIPDVAAGTSGPSPALSVLWGLGDGSLDGRLDLGYGSAVAVVAGDFDRDGRLDLAGLDRGFNLLDVYRQTGARIFDSAVSYGTGAQPESLAAGDLDGDGVLDLALVCSGDGTLLARHGNGDGGFGPRVVSSTGIPQPFFLLLADGSGDGVLDAAASSRSAAQFVLLVGNGDLTFSPADANPETVRHPATVLTVGDFTGDGELDAAYVGNGSPGHVEVLAGDDPIGDTPVGTQPVAITAGDWNGDGRLDVAVANAGSGTLSILRSTDPPVITGFAASPSAGYPPLLVNFSVTAHDPDGAIASYAWDFDGNGSDDQTTTVPTASFTYTGTGGFSPRVRVTDNVGASVSATTSVATNVSPTVSIADVSVPEGNSGTTNAVFTVTLAHGTGPVTVDYFTSGNLYCPAGVAYVGSVGNLDPRGTLSLSPASPTATITVQVIGDTEPEPDCSFTVQLANLVGAGFQRSNALGNIVDDDQVVPALTVDDVSLREGFFGQGRLALFSVRLSARSNTPVTVGYATSSGSAQVGSDYDAASGTLSFDAGETLKVVAVTVHGDEVTEPDETFFLDLQSPVGATIADGHGVATLLADEGQVAATTSVGWSLDREGMTNVNGLASNGSLYVAVGTSASVWTSPDGVAWTRRSVPISDPNRALTAVTWGNGQFVAVGNCCAEDGGGLVLTSPDGTTWTRRSTLPSVRAWSAVTWGGGLYVAAGGSRVLTSPDGIAWTDRPTSARYSLRGIAHGNGRFVAVGANRTLVTSTDAISWQARNLPSAVEARLNAVVWTGSQFVIASGDPSSTLDSGGSILTSPDGLTWTQRSLPTAQPLNGLAVGAGLIVATGGTDGTPVHNSILTSPDGVIWTARAVPLPAIQAATPSLGPIAFGPAGFLAGSGRGTLFGSPDGTTWQSRTLPASRLLDTVAWDGATFCAVGYNGAVSRSTDGIHWTDVATGLDPDRYFVWYSVIHANGQFVMAGANLAIMTSPDCQTWTRRYPASDPPYGPSSGSLFDLTWGGGLYVAVGMRNPTTTTAVPVIFTSPDAITWTERTSAVPAGTRRRLVTTAWGAGRFVAFAEDLDTLQVFLNTSEDGQTWTLRESPAPDMYLPENANDVVFGEGRFVMVADRIRTSTDGISWTVRQDWGDDYSRGLAYGSGRFLAVGQPGAIYLSDDGERWTKNTVPTGNVLYGAAVAGRRLVALGDSVALHADLPAPIVSVQADVSVAEGNSGATNAVFSVGLADASDVTTTVDYFTSNADAVAGSDYDAMSGTLTFLPGVVSQAVAVPVHGDTRGEANEGFWLNLANPWGATLGTRARVATILNDDAQPCVAVNDAELPEGNTGSRTLLFNVYLSAGGYTPTTLTYATTPGTATPGTDYLSVAGTLTFDPGVRSLVVPVTVNGDGAVEPDETFFLDISNVTNATVCDARGQASILDDESAPVPPALGTLSLVREGPLYYGAASDGQRYVLVGQNGDIWTSTDTIAWTRASNPDPLRRTLWAVTWGGGGFVAVGQWNAFAGGGDGGPVVLTSPDGVTWTKQAAPGIGNRNLYAVTWGGGRYLAVGQGGRTLTSLDGVTWTHVNTSAANTLLGIAWGNGLYVAAGNNRTIVTSPDAVNWTLRSVPTGSPISLGPTLHTGSLFVVGARSSPGGILTSSDGVDWTLRATPASGGVMALGQGSGRLVAVGSIFGDNGVPPNQPSSLEPTPTLWTSTDAITWSAATLAPGTGVSSNLHAVTWGALGFLTGGVRGNVYTSPDGLTWTDRTPAAARQLAGVAHDGVRFCAVGTNGAILASTDGTAWTQQPGPSPAAYWHWNEVTWTGSQFLAVGVSSAIMTSPDCSAWTVRYPASPLAPGPATSFLNDVATNGSVLVAVGETYPSAGQTVPLMLASADGGATWTPRTPPVPTVGQNAWITVAWGGGQFVAFGKDYASGELFSATSPDGLTWTARATDVFDNGAFEEINDVAFGNGVFVAAADRIWSSRDAIHWTLRKEYGSYFHGVAWTGSRFVAAAAYGEVWTSPDGEVWSPLAPATTHDLYAMATSPSGHLVAVGQNVVVATDAAAFGIGDTTIGEGGGATFAVTLSVPSTQTTTVAWATADGTALAGSDYAGAAGVLTFPAGVTSGTLSVATLQDGLDEADETLRVVLSTPVGAGLGDAEGVGTIADDDALPALSVNDVSVVEPASGSANATFTVTLAPVSGRTVTVAYATADATATAPADYSAGSGVLTFPAGTTSRTFSVPVLADALDESDEAFAVTLTAPTAATIADGSGTGTILDGTPSPLLTIADASSLESSGSLSFAVSLSAASGRTVTVAYATGGGTATAGTDYTATSGTLTFPAGTTSRSVVVSVQDDAMDEDDETIVVALSSPVNAPIGDGTGLGTILDDDPLPGLAISEAAVAEGNSGSVPATFTVTLSPASGRTVTVGWTTADATATSPADYASASGSLTFPAGTTSRTVTVQVAGDTLDEDDETFRVDLQAPANGTLQDASGTGTITDDDALPAVTIGDALLTEIDAAGRTATLTLTLTPASGRPASVLYTTLPGTASAGSDFTAATGTLTFAAGQTTRVLTLAIAGDRLPEPRETFSVELLSVTNATLADASGVVTIRDDDPEAADFGGDGTADLAIYRSGSWLLFDYATGTASGGAFTGQPTGNCIPAPFDRDGDGKVEFTQLCQDRWYFYGPTGLLVKSILTGGTGLDRPLPADYDGDGRDDIALYRQGAWLFFDYATGSQIGGVFTGHPANLLGGEPIPYAGDFDGDGRADLSIWAGGPWHFYNADGSYLKGVWVGGVPGDLPMAGDYDGDAVDDIVVWRGGAWLFYDFVTGLYLPGRSVYTGAPPHATGGVPLPAPADVDGDGRLEFAVYSGGPWHYFRDDGTYDRGIWCGAVAGDLPVSRRPLP